MADKPLKEAAADQALSCMVNAGLNHGETRPQYGWLKQQATDATVSVVADAKGHKAVQVEYESHLGLGVNDKFKIDDRRAVACAEGQSGGAPKKHKAPSPHH